MSDKTFTAILDANPTAAIEALRLATEAAQAYESAIKKASESSLRVSVRASKETASATKSATKETNIITEAIRKYTSGVEKLEQDLARLRRVTDPATKATNEYKRAIKVTTDALERRRIQATGALQVEKKLNRLYKSSLTPLGRLHHMLMEVNRAQATATTESQKRMVALARENVMRKIQAKREAEAAKGTRGLTLAIEQQVQVMVSQASPALATMIGQNKGLLLAAGAATGVILAGVAAFKASASASADFSFAQAQLANKLGLASKRGAESERIMNRVRDAALDAGLVTRFSATEATSGIEALVTSGFTMEQAIGGIVPALQLATALNLGIEESAQLAAAATNAYSHEATSLEERLGMLAKVTTVSAIRQDELQIALGNSAKGAIAANQPLAEMLTIMRFARDAGVAMETVSTGLGNALLKVAEKAENGRLAIGKQTVSVMDATGNFRKFGDILIDVDKALEGLSRVEQAKILSETFGERSVTPVLAALDRMRTGIRDVSGELRTGADAMDAYRGQLADSGKELQAQAENMQGTVKETVQIISGQWETLLTLIGEDTKGAVKDAADAFSGLLAGTIDIKRAGAGLSDVWLDIANPLALLSDRFSYTALAIDKQTEANMEANASTDALAAAVQRLRLRKAREAEATNEAAAATFEDGEAKDDATTSTRDAERASREFVRAMLAEIEAMNEANRLHAERAAMMMESITPVQELAASVSQMSSESDSLLPPIENLDASMEALLAIDNEVGSIFGRLQRYMAGVGETMSATIEGVNQTALEAGSVAIANAAAIADAIARSSKRGGMAAFKATKALYAAGIVMDAIKTFTSTMVNAPGEVIAKTAQATLASGVVLAQLSALNSIAPPKFHSGTSRVSNTSSGDVQTTLRGDEAVLTGAAAERLGRDRVNALNAGGSMGMAPVIVPMYNGRAFDWLLSDSRSRGGAAAGLALRSRVSGLA